MMVDDKPAVRIRPDDFAHTGPGTLAGPLPAAASGSRSTWPRDLPRRPRASRSASWARTSRSTAARAARRTWSRSAARTAARSSAPAGWRATVSAASTTAGSTTAPASASRCPPRTPASRPRCRSRSYPDRGVPGADLRLPGRGRAAAAAALPRVRGRGRARAPARYVRECNYFHSIENSMRRGPRGVRPPRRPTFTDVGLTCDLPEVTGEETEYGIVSYGTRANGSVRVSHFFMPNIAVHQRLARATARRGWPEHSPGACPSTTRTHQQLQGQPRPRDRRGRRALPGSGQRQRRAALAACRRRTRSPRPCCAASCTPTTYATGRTS